MQNNNPFYPSKPKRSKKALFISLSAVLVLAIAVGTAFILKQVKDPVVTETAKDTSLTGQLTQVYASSNTGKTISLATPSTQKSGTEGYVNAQAKVQSGDLPANSSAFFYQTPDSAWHFLAVSASQDSLPCSTYNTEELKNSYVGFTCFDTTTNKSSFVQKDAPKFEVVPGSIGG